MQIKRFQYKFKKAVIVFVQLEQTGMTLRACKISREKNKSQPNWIDHCTIDELIKSFGKHYPYFLHVNGFGVLTRVVENTPNFKESLLVSGNEDDFYFNSFAIKGSIGVAFVRRSLISDFLTELKSRNVFLLGIHLGPIPLLVSLPDHYKYVGEYSIELNNGKIIKLEKNSNSLQELISDKLITESIKSPFFDLPTDYIQGLDDNELVLSKLSYREYQRFVALGITIVSFFLISLTANYFYVNHLNQEVANLESEISSFGNNLSRIEGLTQEKQRKMILIDNSGVQTKKYVSYYLDRIGKTTPMDIDLNILETFPLIDPIKQKKKVEIGREFIKIEGYCDRSESLDNWIEKLEQEDWIMSVELNNFVRETDKRSVFQLTLKLQK